MDSGTATATELTGLSRAELRESCPTVSPPSTSLLLPRQGRLTSSRTRSAAARSALGACPAGPPLSTSFAKTIAHRAMHTNCLRQDLGLFDRHELSRLLATHLPALASNTENMRWKKYIYRRSAKAEGFSCETRLSRL
ncbi:nitrogen fixation protein NifQ [Mesorhizobium sp.]|uniref:nitrogen fixation protein NifQ n=1 Tax=Mesorhizobium sp. TaxID=1871066 RepID=UPI003450FC41